jgi:tRNA (cmo5U34)-methyltransferase
MMENEPIGWSEDDSAQFLAAAAYFVPERLVQHHLIADLIPPAVRGMTIIELCCGDGALAATLLQRFPSSTLWAYDGSARMRQHARHRLAPFGARAQVSDFDLGAEAWRRVAPPAHAIVSSLCIHHLNHEAKKQLFADLLRLLLPGGILVVADIIQPTTVHATAMAAHQWDEAVRAQTAAHGKPERFDQFETGQWNVFRFPDPGDRPATVWDQLQWLAEAGFVAVDVYWMQAGHAIFGGQKQSSSEKEQ